MNLLEKFTTLRLEPTESMVDYLTRAVYVSRQLELARGKVSENMLTSIVLKSLPSEYGYWKKNSKVLVPYKLRQLAMKLLLCYPKELITIHMPVRTSRILLVRFLSSQSANIFLEVLHFSHITRIDRPLHSLILLRTLTSLHHWIVQYLTSLHHMTSLSNLTNYTVHLIFTHSSGNYGFLLVSYTRRLVTTLLDSPTQYQIA